MAKIIESNLELKLKSAIVELQISYAEYKKAITDYFQWTGYNDDGDFYTLEDHEDRLKKVHEYAEAVERNKAIVDEIKAIVDEIKAMMEGHDENHD